MQEMSPDMPLYKHPKPHRELIRRHVAHWGKRDTFVATILSILAFAASIVVVFYAISYATESASNSVTDLVLSNIAVYEVDGFFIYGMFLLIAFITLLCLTHPKRIPYTLFCLALFYLVRSFFISLTHIAPYPSITPIDFGETLTKMFFGGDLFFSGHTGAPFLMALLYWREPTLRYVFLLWSMFFALIVLLGHLHYSIDVAAAYFITYGIYHIAERAFPSSRALFYSDPFRPRS